MIFNTLKVLAIAILINLISGQVMADRDVSTLQILEGDWIFVPTTLDGSVESFVGLRIDGVAGENITTVWFLRTTEEAWDSWAWSEQDQGKAIACIKSILALPDSTDDNWPVAISTEAADAPKVLKKGVLESDPFESVIDGLADPELLVTMLEDTGWAAAWLELWEYDCEDEVILDTWVEVYEEGNFSNEQFKGHVYERLMQDDCFTTHINDQIWCWVDQYWTSFDEGTPISFNGDGLLVHRTWHPFFEVIEEYRGLYPSVPIVEAVVDNVAWNALAPTEQQAFRDLSRTLDYAVAIRGKLSPDLYPNPGDVPPPDTPTIPSTPECGDHQLFYDKILQYLDETPWGSSSNSLASCLYVKEGPWLWCSLSYDCYDIANNVGACLANKFQDDGITLVPYNMGVWFRCGLLRRIQFGHTYTCLYYCGYWYIIDESKGVIAIIEGQIDEDIPLEGLSCLFLENQGIDCDGNCAIEYFGKWPIHQGPMFEHNLWYTSRSEVARVVACLRDSGMSEAAIQEAVACCVPSDQLPSVLLWFDPPPPSPFVTPYVPYISPNNPCPTCYTLER